MAVRPTPDRLREALFNVLAPRIPGTVFIDAYAGSGAVGIEALSRGAKRVVLIERKAAAIAVIRDNVASLGVANEVTVVRGSAAIVLPNYSADIAFIDPPYEQPEEYAEAMLALSGTDGLVIAQHASRAELDERYGALVKTRVLKQGDNSLSFYERTQKSNL
jgi:16S rRNA (guanine(966)-N(2))-methyltransferase RsmD